MLSSYIPLPPQREIVSLRRLCLDNSRNNESGEYTHLDLSGNNGGKFYIPDEDNYRLLSAYAEDILRKEPLYLVERRTKVFKMNYDYDLKTTAKDAMIPTDHLLIFREIILDVARFYPSVMDPEDKRHLFMCIIASSPDKVVSYHPPADGESVGEPNEIKVGFHLHFPNLRVTQEQALLIHMSAASVLERKITPVRPLQFGQLWPDVLDSCVYHANGLRMIESDKCATCPDCKNKDTRRPSCSFCKARGKVSEGRPYSPMCTLDGNGVPDNDFTAFLQSNTHEMVKLTSIRCFDREPDTRFVRYTGSPSPYPVECKRTGNKIIAHRKRDFLDDVRNTTVKTNKEPIQSQGVYDALNRIIKKNLPSVYNNLEIRSATYADRAKDAIWLRVCGEGSNFCQNVNRDHSSNTIWFYITMKGITQKCFSTKNRPSERNCCNYSSEKIPLPRVEVNILFPPTSAQKKRNREIINNMNNIDDDSEQLGMAKLIQTLEMIVFKTHPGNAGQSQNRTHRRDGKRGSGRQRIEKRTFDA